ncbi:MAG: asparagine synthase (glutamine-hydrolyzing) [Deltaproteobacteria bacterium]|nr:asparagine synthase (glutamine-hydrolyzing) [Deltaproteobacteria bacterium]
MSDPAARVRAMSARIVHRGPDDDGEFVTDDGRVAMAFRRLSIQDLSAQGHQPMASPSGRFTICFNGEVYNFPELRSELRGIGVAFRGGSDTEVIVAAIERWGLSTAVTRMAGMFAIALWDSREKELLLVRDRFGVKPLYYGCPGRDDVLDGRVAGETFLFASEMKALRPAFSTTPDIHRGALHALLQYQYTPAPWTLWRGIHKLLPGHILRYQMRTGRIHTECYWSAGRALEQGARDPVQMAPEEVAAELERQVESAVRDRMVADVPLGAFLSGGIDSSIVVSAMQRLSASNTQTFTIGTDDEKIDESDAAARIASHLGTDHRTIMVREKEAQGAILRLSELIDEPFGDASLIPAYLVSKFARESVTVVLSGDGGDEVFAGYPQHRFGALLFPQQRKLGRTAPRWARRFLLDENDFRLRPALGDLRSRLLPGVRAEHLQARLEKALRVAGEPDRARFMRCWRELVVQPGRYLASGPLEFSAWPEPDCDFSAVGGVRSECWADLTGYMVDDVLLKVDRASMAVSLEAREPLLDHRLFEFAARIPADMLVREGQGKWILRQALYRSVPKRLVDGPKKGFALPVAGWVIGPLRDWAEALLAEDRLEREGYFDAAAVRSAWLHLCGDRPAPEHAMPFFGLWSILAFQAWLDQNEAGDGPAR